MTNRKIALLGAMEEEILPLLEHYTNYETVEYAENKYYIIKENGTDIVIANSKIGKIFAALTAATLIQHFKCEMILFTGVAGGINPSLKIGDMIIADKLCQHDLDITAFGHPHGYVPGGKVFLEPTKELITLVKEVAKESNIDLITGTIATGDQFVADAQRKNFIEKTFNADALEMEGVAVAVVCDALNIPYVIIRSISDTANGNADVDFDTFLQNAAQNSAKLMLNIINKLEEK
jgi:adenosylhomocysteine/aminodeoxyfutalosine nucleosidase